MNKYIVKVAAQYVAQVHIYTASRQTKPNRTPPKQTRIN